MNQPICLKRPKLFSTDQLHSYRLPEDLGRELDRVYARAEAELGR